MTQHIILGAGVIGLTTALTLKQRSPHSHVILTAQFLPGDSHISYASPWAGANWLSVATDNGRQEAWDEIAYRKFAELVARRVNEAGVSALQLKALFDNERAGAGVESVGTRRIWYEGLAGVREVRGEELLGARFGFECESFVVDVGIYLSWLVNQVLKAGVEIRRARYESIHDLLAAYPDAKTFVNCTGIGSYWLKGVEDHDLYPTLGQTLLVSPPRPIKKMYFRSPQRTHADTTYVFPRGEHGSGGVVLGGCRIDGVWDAQPSEELAEDIKQRCCALCPELGKPEDLKVLKIGVGLRPSRKGGARIERVVIDGRTVVHNYGAGGAGYQASWGMAKEAVDLALQSSRL